jgi:hypothetical protein
LSQRERAFVWHGQHSVTRSFTVPPEASAAWSPRGSVTGKPPWDTL